MKNLSRELVSLSACAAETRLLHRVAASVIVSQHLELFTTSQKSN